MQKRHSLVTVLSLLFLLAAVTEGFSQVKKTAVKKTTVKTTTVKPKQPTVKTNTIKKIPGIRVKLITDSGTMILRLYDSTPLHRDNFAKLVQQGFYDSLMFHRVMLGFMIQGGDPQSKYAPPGIMLGNGGGDMPLIPAELKPSLYHKKGVLAAARTNNPEKASSACQFYIVQGKKYSDAELNDLEMGMGIKFTPAQRKAYKETGGTPMLDMNYTVYGEVESGMDVIDRIAGVPVDQVHRPFGDIRMKMELIRE